MSEIQQESRLTKATHKMSFFRARRGKLSPFATLIVHVILIVASLFMLYPILRVLTVALRPGDRLLSTSLAIIPQDATFANFIQVLTEKNMILWIWNSAVITIFTAFIGVALASTSAYAFSRWKFPGRTFGLIFLLTTQMIPAAMMMVPLYILAVNLRLINTYVGLVLAYSVGSIPFSIWILKGYYDTIPPQLEEAAMIDGASRMYAFRVILLPLTKPALAIIFLFNFMQAWNDFLLARVMLQREVMKTWPLGLQSLQQQFQTSWGMFAAGALIVGIPVVVLFLYSSKWLVSGLTLGSVKG
ncbi:MAG: sugar ABC transporter permease [Spirochaetia bacterium]